MTLLAVPYAELNAAGSLLLVVVALLLLFLLLFLDRGGALLFLAELALLLVHLLVHQRLEALRLRVQPLRGHHCPALLVLWERREELHLGGLLARPDDLGLQVRPVIHREETAVAAAVGARVLRPRALGLLLLARLLLGQMRLLVVLLHVLRLLLSRGFALALARALRSRFLGLNFVIFSWRVIRQVRQYRGTPVHLLFLLASALRVPVRGIVYREKVVVTALEGEILLLVTSSEEIVFCLGCCLLLFLSFLLGETALLGFSF